MTDGMVRVVEVWWGWMVPMAWQVAVLVTVLLGLSWLLRRRSARLRYALWLLVPLRLMLPPTLALMTGWGWWVLPAVPPAPVIKEAAAAAPVPWVRPAESTRSLPEVTGESPGVVASLPPVPPPAPMPALERAEPARMAADPAPAIAWRDILFRVWVAVSMALGIRLLVGWRKAVGLVRRSGPGPAIPDGFALPRRIRVRTSAGISTPMLIGIRSPTILLPAGIERRLSREEMAAVLVHELQHVARRDALVQLAQAAAVVAYWFHPLVWLANRRIDRLREDACDEATVAALENRRQAYGAGLLKVAELASGKKPILALGIAESGSPVKRRLARILDPRLPAGRRLTRPAFAALLLVAAVLLPSAARRAGAVADPAARHEVRRGGDPMPDPADAPHGVHRLTVEVVDAKTGDPIPDAEVRSDDWTFFFDYPRRLTDNQGRYHLLLPLPDETILADHHYEHVSVAHSNYAPRSVAWTSPQGNVLAGLPEEVRIELESGVSIGGLVRDESGRVLPGVRVLLSGSGYQGYSSADSFREHRYPSISIQDPEQPAAVTDDQGRWRFDRFPRDLRTLEIMFIRPDDSRETYVTRNETLGDAYPVLSMEDLRSGTATAILEDGIRVRGLVVDEAGRPVPHATVRESYGVQNAVRTSTFATDADGRFERTNRAPREWVYTATAPGRATVSEVVKVYEGMPGVRMVLPPARPMTIRAVDEAGRPVAGAEIRIAPTQRNQGQALEWEARTDDTGTAVWTNAPLQTVTLWGLDTPNNAFRQFKGRAGDEITVTFTASALNDRAFVDIRATDAESGEPVKMDSVGVSYDSNGFRPLAEPHAAECRVEVRPADSADRRAYSYRFRVAAEGYQPYATEQLEFSEGDQVLDVAMIRGEPAEGVVRLADGTPVAGATLWAPRDDGGANARVYLNETGVYPRQQMISVASAEDGRFALPVLGDNLPVVVTHDLGFADVMLPDVRTSGEIVLQPYGRIEGRLLVNGRPAPDRDVLLTQQSVSTIRGFGGRTDEEGRFVFEQVPAGEYTLDRRVTLPDRSIVATQQMPVVVPAGETVQVEYGPGGRTIAGEAVSDPPGLHVDWESGRHVLERRLPPMPNVRRDDFVTSSAWAAALNAAQEQSASFRREEPSYVLSFDPSGAFHVHDVQPGDYELTIQVTRPPEPGTTRYRVRSEDILGERVQDVTVPPGTEPFDLGEVLVPMTGLLDVPTGYRMSLLYRTADGATHQLRDARGRPVVLLFWAGWSKRSQAALAELRQRHQGIADDHDAAFLSVNLDTEPDPARSASDARDDQWTEAVLDDAERLRALAAFEIRTLPGIFVLDGDGRVFRRDLDPVRVAEAVRLARVMMSKQETGGAR